jgi:hypothetical protein
LRKEEEKRWKEIEKNCLQEEKKQQRACEKALKEAAKLQKAAEAAAAKAWKVQSTGACRRMTSSGRQNVAAGCLDTDMVEDKDGEGGGYTVINMRPQPRS